MPEATMLTDENFAAETGSGTVLVDFFAPWCGACQSLMPTVDAIAKDPPGAVKVAKVNVEENNATAQDFNVMSIPTLIVFVNGKEKTRSVGKKSKNEILAMLK